MNLENLKNLWAVPAGLGIIGAIASKGDSKYLFGAVALGSIAGMFLGNPKSDEEKTENEEKKLRDDKKVADNIKTMVLRLKSAIGTWNLMLGSACVVLKDFMEMSDDDIRAVAQHYDNTYGRTVRKDLSEIINDCMYGFFNSRIDDVTQKLNELNIP